MPERKARRRMADVASTKAASRDFLLNLHYLLRGVDFGDP